MPGLDTKLHLNMLQRARRRGQIEKDGIYGMHWGRVDQDEALRMVRDTYLYPFINPDRVALEIGPGGGRWTKYLLSFGKIFIVDFYQEMLDEHRRLYKAPHLIAVKNNGTDFPGIPDRGVDFVWSYGTFVHLDLDLIERYLAEIPRILTPKGQVVIHYADKRKPKAEANPSFSNNTPEKMRTMVEAAGYVIEQEDTESLDHSAIMRFARR